MIIINPSDEQTKTVRDTYRRDLSAGTTVTYNGKLYKSETYEKTLGFIERVATFVKAILATASLVIPLFFKNTFHRLWEETYSGIAYKILAWDSSKSDRIPPQT